MALEILDAARIRRALIRIAHEIVERNAGTDRLAVIGIQTRGVPLAKRIGEAIAEMEGCAVDVGSIDATMYRDDAGKLGVSARVEPTSIPFNLDGRTVVLVDDVLYTGRTIRSALDALIDLGRPAAVQLAVLVDRGHRELPIRADYVGKNVPTAKTQNVRVAVEEVDGTDTVEIEEEGDGE